LYFHSVDLLKINILDLLDNTTNKKVTLTTHIKQLENVQDKLSSTISSLINVYTQEETMSQTYYQQKEQ